MRTKVSVEDSLLQKAKKIEHERRSSLRTVIENALRAAVAKERKRTQSGAPRPLKTFKGTGLRPGIGLSSSAAFLDSMESR
jgi:hypothetical protein